MRIAIDARMINASGIGRYLSNILKAFRSLEIEDVSLVGNRRQLSGHCLPSWNIVESDLSFYSPFSGLRFPIRGRKVDVMYFPHINVPFFLKPGKKNLVTIHDVFHLLPISGIRGPAKIYMHLMYANALGMADQIFCASRTTLDMVRDLFGEKIGKKAVVSYSPFDAEQFSAKAPRLDNTSAVSLLLQKHKAKKKLLFVGNVKPHKNLQGLVNAMQSNIFGDCVLFIVGKRDGFITGVQTAQQKLLESDRVEFTGYVSDAELRHMYASADLLVFPSLYEGFGYPPLEALSLGLPVVASNLDVVREICGDTVSYFDPRSVESMRSTIRQCLDGPDMSKDPVHAEKVKQLLEKYSLEHTAIAQVKRILGV